MRLFLIYVLTSASLSGCASHHTRTYQEFDRSDKSISMPIGSGGLLGDIKDGFIRNGYRVIADTGGVRTTGVTTSEQVSQSEHKSRYKLFINYYETPVLKFCMVRYEYNIYIIDTNNGMEVMNMSGKDCQKDIATKVFKALGLE